MSAPTLPRSTAEARRVLVVSRAVAVFSRSGYWATPVTDVAAAAKISPAYVFRLFDSKLGLFVAALEHCYTQVVRALEDAADRSAGAEPDEMLAAMGDAYARLIADRSLLMLQVHALSAADVPEIAEAIREGCARVVTLVEQRTRASEAAIQQFMAYGQLCHLIVAAGLNGLTPSWARLLTAGMAHPDHVEGVADSRD